MNKSSKSLRNEGIKHWPTKSIKTNEKKEAITEQTEEEDAVLVPPDGGWGWVVVTGAFFSMLLTALPHVGFGILFAPLLMGEGVSSALVAWVFNIHGFIWNFTALLDGPLCEEFGWRKVAFLGGILSFISIFISALVPNTEFLFLSYSLLGGIASGTSATTALFATSRYFQKRRGLALGISNLGMCTGGFISPIFASFLLQQYGFFGAALIYSGIVLNVCVCSMLFHPVRWHMKKVSNEVITKDKLSEESLNEYPNMEEIKLKAKRLRELQRHKLSEISAYSLGSAGHSILDISTLPQCSAIPVDDETLEKEKSHPFLKRIAGSTYQSLVTLKYFQVIIICISSGCTIIGYVNFQMWISFAVVDKGHSLQTAAWCVSSASIGNVFGRLIMSCLADLSKFSVKLGFMIGIFSIATFIVAFTLVTDTAFILLFLCCWGFSVGATMSLYPIVMIETMGIDLFPAVFGVASLTNGVFVLIFGPLIGKIRDVTSSYAYAIWFISGIVYFGFLLWVLMPLAKAHDGKKQEPIESKGQFL